MWGLLGPTGLWRAGACLGRNVSPGGAPGAAEEWRGQGRGHLGAAQPVRPRRAAVRPGFSSAPAAASGFPEAPSAGGCGRPGRSARRAESVTCPPRVMMSEHAVTQQVAGVLWNPASQPGLRAPWHAIELKTRRHASVS